MVSFWKYRISILVPEETVISNKQATIILLLLKSWVMVQMKSTSSLSTKNKFQKDN